MKQEDMFSVEDNVVDLRTLEDTKTVKQRGPFDPDEILVRWTQEASNDPGESEHNIRVARFKNGKRGIQFIRGTEIKNPSFVATLTLHQNEYYSLAQCVFRDSQWIRELCEKYPPGTEPTVDKIRDFCKPTSANVVRL